MKPRCLQFGEQFGGKPFSCSGGAAGNTQVGRVCHGNVEKKIAANSHLLTVEPTEEFGDWMPKDMANIVGFPEFSQTNGCAESFHE